MTPHIENATIVQTMLGTEDHGILTAIITVQGDGWGCEFGGIALDQFDDRKNRRVGSALGTEFILQLLNTLEVSSWEKLTGTHVRVVLDGQNGGIVRIGHFLKDRWFSTGELTAP